MTNTLQTTSQLDHQKGNVLFLILIAVVLFAALSYAVTQSSRTGGGDAARETNLISSAEISQYPAAVKTAIVRMIIDGITYEELKFNPPSDFGGLASGGEAQGVFHPTGGAAVYLTASPDIMVTGGANEDGIWYFNPDFEVKDIGTSTASSGDGNEFIAFLPGIKQAICLKVNEEVGIDAPIPATNITVASVESLYDDGDSGVIPNEVKIIGDTSSSGASSGGLSGQAFGCFQSATSTVYVYYQVLSER